jgi:hypothetical protein
VKENREELDRLLEEMAEETPEMPADFHARWTKQIQEEQKAHKHSERTRQTRYILSAAALFVFLVGGTLITRGWNKRNQAVTAPAPQAKVMYSVDAGGAAMQADALQAAEEREEAAEADKAAPMEEAPVMAAQMKEASGMAGNAAEAPDMMMAEAAESAAEEEVYGEAAEAPAMKEAVKDAAAKRAEEPADAAAAAGTAETEAAAVKETGKTEAAAKPAEAPKEENGFISFMRDFANFSLKALGVLAVIAGLAAAVIAGRRYISKNNSKK